MKLSPRVLICSWIWEVLVLGFFADTLEVWENVGSKTGGCGIEISGVKSLDDASSSASSSSSATSDRSVTLLCISSCDERLYEASRVDDGLGRGGLAGGPDGTAGLGAAKCCVCLAGLGEVVELAAMVNGVIKGAEPFDSSEISSLGGMILIVRNIIG